MSAPPATVKEILMNSLRSGRALAGSLLIAAALAAAFSVGALAQPKDQPKKDQPMAQPAQPVKPAADASTGEAPDGTKLPILARSQIAIMIEDLKVGDGKEASASSTITIHYHGVRASDGHVFDSTRGKEPATFPLARLIPGWQAGIPGMKVGGIRVLHIPYQFAYGERGAGADIPPKCDLVFAIELKDVK